MLVPGILGTELINPHTQATVWGRGVKQLTDALISGSVYDQLRDPALVPTRLLRRVGSMPLFGRFEPYTDLVDTLRRQVAHPDAFVEYPYDWRRSVSELGEQFAIDAAEHLERWRRHPMGSRDAQLSLVAHSMGGLVALQALALPSGLKPTSVRQLLTLGTPYLGSTKAARALATGEVLPGGWAIRERTKQRLRAMAVETRSVYDLLPFYPSTYLPGAAHTTAGLARPTVDDFVAVGATKDFVEAAQLASEQRLSVAHLSQVWPLVGVGQATLQSFRVDSSGTTFYEDVGGYDWGGDGTVHFHAAYPQGGNVACGLAQTHGALAKSEEAQSTIVARLLGGTPGPWQSVGALGLHAADSVARDETFTIEGRVPPGIIPTCRWHEASTGLSGQIPLGPARTRTVGGQQTDIRTAVHAWRSAGLYTVAISGGGSSPVSVDVLVEDDE